MVYGVFPWEQRRTYNKCLEVPNDIWLGIQKDQRIPSWNTSRGSLPRFRVCVACCPPSLSPLDLCASESWDDCFPAPIFDVKGGNSVVYMSEDRIKLGKGGFILAAFSYLGTTLPVICPQSLLYSPQLPAQGLSFPIKLRLPEGKNISALFTNVSPALGTQSVLNKCIMSE